VGNKVTCRAFLPLPFRWHCGPGVTDACQSKSATELGHILNVSARTVGWCALVQLSWVLAWRRGVAHRKQVAPAYVPVQRVPEMAPYENDLKSERLKLPASSLWISRITVFLVVLGVVIALA
jgi:hypothetical protein